MSFRPRPGWTYDRDGNEVPDKRSPEFLKGEEGGKPSKGKAASPEPSDTVKRLMGQLAERDEQIKAFREKLAAVAHSEIQKRLEIALAENERLRKLVEPQMEEVKRVAEVAVKAFSGRRGRPRVLSDEEKRAKAAAKKAAYRERKAAEKIQ